MSYTPEDTAMNQYTLKYNKKPLFTKEQLESITKKATLVQKFRLLFVRSEYTFDGDGAIRYKQMDGITFVMKRGTRL